MAIYGSWSREFTVEQLEDLFLSVDWESGKYPKKLREAILNYDKVYSLWDDSELVGMICSMSDQVLTVYFQYLLVKPKYQGQGLGKKLMKKMLKEYAGIPRKILISMGDKIGFYESFGFVHHDDKGAMFITTL